MDFGTGEILTSFQFIAEREVTANCSCYRRKETRNYEGQVCNTDFAIF